MHWSCSTCITLAVTYPQKKGPWTLTASRVCGHEATAGSALRWRHSQSEIRQARISWRGPCGWHEAALCMPEFPPGELWTTQGQPPHELSWRHPPRPRDSLLSLDSTDCIVDLQACLFAGTTEETTSFRRCGPKTSGIGFSGTNPEENRFHPTQDPRYGLGRYLSTRGLSGCVSARDRDAPAAHPMRNPGISFITPSLSRRALRSFSAPPFPSRSQLVCFLSRESRSAHILHFSSFGKPIEGLGDSPGSEKKKMHC